MVSHPVLSNEHLAAIGALVVESSNLEMFLDGMLCVMLRLKKQQYDLLLDGAMMQRKLNLLHDLGTLRLRSKKRKLQLTAIIGELKQCNSQRVAAVHGIWESKDGRLNQLKVLMDNVNGIPQPPKKAIATKERLNQKALQLDADKVEETVDKLIKWHKKLLTFYVRALTPRSNSKGPA
jgi:hypothetical protein